MHPVPGLRTAPAPEAVWQPVQRSLAADHRRIAYRLLFISNPLKQHRIGMEENDDGISPY